MNRTRGSRFGEFSSPVTASAKPLLAVESEPRRQNDVAVLPEVQARPKRFLNPSLPDADHMTCCSATAERRAMQAGEQPAVRLDFQRADRVVSRQRRQRK